MSVDVLFEVIDKLYIEKRRNILFHTEIFDKYLVFDNEHIRKVQLDNFIEIGNGSLGGYEDLTVSGELSSYLDPFSTNVFLLDNVNYSVYSLVYNVVNSLKNLCSRGECGLSIIFVPQPNEHKTKIGRITFKEFLCKLIKLNGVITIFYNSDFIKNLDLFDPIRDVKIGGYTIFKDIVNFMFEEGEQIRVLSKKWGGIKFWDILYMPFLSLIIFGGVENILDMLFMRVISKNKNAEYIISYFDVPKDAGLDVHELRERAFNKLIDLFGESLYDLHVHIRKKDFVSEAIRMNLLLLMSRNIDGLLMENC